MTPDGVYGPSSLGAARNCSPNAPEACSWQPGGSTATAPDFPWETFRAEVRRAIATRHLKFTIPCLFHAFSRRGSRRPLPGQRAGSALLAFGWGAGRWWGPCPGWPAASAAYSGHPGERGQGLAPPTSCLSPLASPKNKTQPKPRQLPAKPLYGGSLPALGTTAVVSPCLSPSFPQLLIAKGGCGQLASPLLHPLLFIYF